MIPQMISTYRFRALIFSLVNKCIDISRRISIWEVTPNMEMIKETRIKIVLTALTLDQCINILAIKSFGIRKFDLILFYSNFLVWVPLCLITELKVWLISKLEWMIPVLLVSLILWNARASSNSFIQNSLI